MCNAYANKIPPGEIAGAFAQLRIPLIFPEGLPNAEPRDDIRITDRAPVVRAAAEQREAAELLTLRWSWKGPTGKPVFNYRSEGRRFDKGRCLIPADSFYEFTAAEPGSKRKTRWRFTAAGADWFCIAGLWRDSPEGPAFTMLTADPGADVAPYHDRQVAIVERECWGGWLDYSLEAASVLRPCAGGTLIAARG